MNSFDWQWWHYFLAIAESGSLTKAAQQLHVSQPTLSRQLLAMEQQLGQTLFDRSTQGLQLTLFGHSLLSECQQMQASALRLQRLAQGQAQTLSGRIRLSVNEIIALYYLPSILPDFMHQYPQVSVEVEVNNRSASLDKRDADIAVRMFRPTQLDLVSRHLFDIPLGFYASQEYLEQYGTPTCAGQLQEHRLLGYDRDKQFESSAAELGWTLRNEDFQLRTDSMPLHLNLARHGGGIVVTHQSLARKFNLIFLNIEIELPLLPVYLVCHRDVQHNKRIRVMMDFLAQHLEASL